MNKVIVSIALSDGRTYIEEVNACDHEDAVMKVMNGEDLWKFIGDGDVMPVSMEVRPANGKAKNFIKTTITKEELDTVLNHSETYAWWFCDNIIDHEGQVGLLHMGFPRLFILMRNYDAAYWADFEEWKRDLIEVTFMEREDEKNTTPKQLNELLVNAWNFLVRIEEAEEDLCEEHEDDE